jgi:hypothetical protein
VRLLVVVLLLGLTAGCQSAAKQFDGTIHDARFVFGQKWELKAPDEEPQLVGTPAR